jgi:hypothetical protein
LIRQLYSYRSHYPVFPDAKAANSADAAMHSLALTIAEPRQIDKDWIVEVQVVESLRLDAVAHWRKQASAVCRDFGGQYDGWGVNLDGQPWN